MAVRTTYGVITALALGALVACQAGSVPSQGGDAPAEGASPRTRAVTSDVFVARYGESDEGDLFAAPIGQLDESVQLGDLAAAAARAGEVFEGADDELVWLDSNPPRPCYADAHSAIRTYVAMLRDGSAVALGGASGDAEAVAEGVQRLDEADFLLQDAYRLIDILDC